ncbi:uncharacterized protein LOC115402434 isoform X5 [Salarias fasciatus]|uniref:uncharacterized protein LOC115402434 isoform X5 n=1 Tax=Salarias fasciatus TaxID=181472 RepID=UPI001176CC9B|nr:uncharacterized protein LOC115402434 isoform X5 [Salarias fasciatus]
MAGGQKVEGDESEDKAPEMQQPNLVKKESPEPGPTPGSSGPAPIPVSPGPDPTSWRKFFVILTGKTNDAHQSVVKNFESLGQTEVRSPDDADYYLVFCPISSRVGTDVSEAMEHLPAGKAAVLVVMHHTFNPEQVIPPSSRLVTDRRVRLTVDCIFYQNDLLSGEFNRKMKAEIKTFFRHNTKNWFARLMKNGSSDTCPIGNWFARLREGVRRCCSATCQVCCRCCFMENSSNDTCPIGVENPHYQLTPEPQTISESDTTSTDHNASCLGQKGSN